MPPGFPDVRQNAQKRLLELPSEPPMCSKVALGTAAEPPWPSKVLLETSSKPPVHSKVLPRPAPEPPSHAKAWPKLWEPRRPGQGSGGQGIHFYVGIAGCAAQFHSPDMPLFLCWWRLVFQLVLPKLLSPFLETNLHKIEGQAAIIGGSIIRPMVSQ